jgi:hypothetical protein
MSDDVEDGASSISIGDGDDEGAGVGDRGVEPLAQRNDCSRFGDVHFNISELEDSGCGKDRVRGKAGSTQSSVQKWLDGLGRSEGLDKLEAALATAHTPRLETVRNPMDTAGGLQARIDDAAHLRASRQLREQLRQQLLGTAAAAPAKLPRAGSHADSCGEDDHLVSGLTATVPDSGEGISHGQ